MQEFKCKTCGAEIKWNASVGALKCEYCDSTFSPEEYEDSTLNDEKVNSMDNIVDKEYSSELTTDEQNIYKCTNCGADIVAMKVAMTAECPYCGMPLSVTNAHKGVFRPEKVLPYSVEKQEASDALKKFFGKSLLTPGSFKKTAEIDNVKGLYVPFFLHNFSMKGKCKYNCENITSERKGDDRVSTHKVYDVELLVNSKFNRVPIDGSTIIDDELMYALEPFNFNDIKDYNPGYMSGYYADQPDETAESTKARALVRGTHAVESRCLELLNKYEKHDKVSSTISSVYYNSEYVMLPVWRINVKYKGKIWQFNVNGRTGEVVGKMPISIFKVTVVSIIIGLASFIAGAFVI